MRWICVLVALVACDCGQDPPRPGCTSSEECEDGVCVAGSCVSPDGGVPDGGVPRSDAEPGRDGGATACESAVFCGAPPMCCGVEEECVDDACVPTCESGVRCGAEGDTCCAAGEVCVSESCTAPGDACTDSFECPIGSFCEPTLERCLPQFEPVTCQTEPVFGPFETMVEREMTSSTLRPDCLHPITAAVVIDLDADGIPEILSNMACDASWGRGVLRAFRGDTAEELWASEVEVHGRVSIAAADLRGDGAIVVVALTSDESEDPNRVIAFSAEGEELWRSVDEMGDPLRVPTENGAPSLADLDGDGSAEIVFGAVALDAEGRRLWERNAGANEGTNDGYEGGIAAIADIDGDMLVDVVAGRRAYERDGTPKWRALTPDGYPAIAQFDDDAQPEVVLVASGEVYLLDGLDGAIQWGPVAIPGGGRGGPPTVADFDGDGLPEIGVAGAESYSVYDPDGARDVLWSRITVDQSSNATGSSVFDFQGDGAAEVVYQDECHIWVYDGRDGRVLLQVPSSSATIHEFPLVVDADGDGNSEIVAVANERAVRAECREGDPEWDGARRGVFVYGDVRDQWVRTRRIWSQHAYHVTDIASNGTIPRVERNNWEVEGLNNYRQNVQGEGVFYAPDLEIAGFEAVLTGCPTMVRLRARVRNVGSLGVAAGVPVSFYRGPLASPGERIETVETEVALLPGATTRVEVLVSLEGEPPYAFHVIVDDDGTGAGVITECNEESNADELLDIACDLLI